MYQKDINECCSKLHYCIMSQFLIENVYVNHAVKKSPPLTQLARSHAINRTEMFDSTEIPPNFASAKPAKKNTVNIIAM